MMKKISRGVIILLIIMAAFITLVGCQSKEAVSVDVFNKEMTSLGYDVQDITNQYAGVNPAILVCSAFEGDGLHVEFFQMDSIESAKSMFDGNKGMVEGYKGNGNVESSVSNNSYQKYTLKSDGTYYVVEQVGETMIYSYAPEDSSKLLDAALGKIGY